MRTARRGKDMLILDASVYTPLLAKAGGKLVKLAKHYVFAILDLTIYEACNVFWKLCVKHKILNPHDAIELCKLTKNLATRLKIYNFNDIDVEKAVTIAIDNNITVYDATYIALAQSIRAAIATEDSDIIRVAPRYGITTLRLEDIFKLIETS
jgi:predicted nucleic acid-binding protein